MSALYDATCPACGKRFGWGGNVSDRPACPKCGHRPSQAELEKADKAMEEAEQRILNRTENVKKLHRQRLGAGLTLREAATLLGINAKDLSDIEQGRKPLTDELADKMTKAYQSKT